MYVESWFVLEMRLSHTMLEQVKKDSCGDPNIFHAAVT